MTTHVAPRSHALHAPTLFGTLVVTLGLLLPLALGIVVVVARFSRFDLMVWGGLAFGFLAGLALLLSTVRVAVQAHVCTDGIATEHFPTFIAGRCTSWYELAHIRVTELGWHELAQRSLVVACIALVGGARKARVVAFGTGRRELVTLTTLTSEQVWARIESVAPAEEVRRLRAAGTGLEGRPTML